MFYQQRYPFAKAMKTLCWISLICNSECAHQDCIHDTYAEVCEYKLHTNNVKLLL